jgi:glycine oxidase
MKSKRVVIIGGGLVGCLTAIEMKDKGFDVSIIDQSELGSGSSMAAGGILFPLMPWDYSSKVYDLCESADKYYESLSKELLKKTGIDLEYSRSGIIIIDPLEPKKINNWCNKNNIKFIEKKFNGNSSIVLKNVSQINPKKLIQSLRIYMQILGIRIYENKKIVDFIGEDNKIKKCLSEDGEHYHGEEFIITSGAWVSNLIKGYKKKIFPVKGQMIQYTNAELASKKIIYRDGFYLIPRKDGTIVAGSTLEEVGFNAEENESNIATLKKKAETIYPQLKDVAIIKSWHGFRPGTFDNIPITEKHKSYKNMYVNSGHHRYGITMGPKSAKIIASLIISNMK